MSRCRTSTTPVVNLAEMRLNRGLTLQAAADEIGVDRQVLANTENGRTVPRANTAYKIATYYGMTVTEIWPLVEAEAVAK